MTKISVEYSSKQKCFHVDFLEKILEINFRDVFVENNNDYKIIKICNSFEEANKFVKKVKEEMKKRSD